MIESFWNYYFYHISLVIALIQNKKFGIRIIGLTADDFSDFKKIQSIFIRQCNQMIVLAWFHIQVRFWFSQVVSKNSVAKLPTLYLRPDQEPDKQTIRNDHAFTWRHAYTPVCLMKIGRFQVQNSAKRYIIFFFISSCLYLIEYYNVR